MLLAAGAVGATGTFAWYQATSNAAVNAITASGDLASTASTVGVATYSINFTVTPADAALQLSHVADSTEATADKVGGASVDSLNEGDLVYGGVHAGSPKVFKVASASDFITSFSISASWASTPTDPSDVTALGGKKFTINLTATGQAKFLTGGSALTGQGNATAATAVVHIAASTLALSVDTLSYSYVHIEPSTLTTSESGTSGAINVTAADNVPLVADN